VNLKGFVVRGHEVGAGKLSYIINPKNPSVSRWLEQAAGRVGARIGGHLQNGI